MGEELGRASNEGRGNGKCQGPMFGKSWVYLRTRKKADVAVKYIGGE